MLEDASETDAVVASPERDGTPFVEAAFQEVRRLDAPALDKQLAAAARSLGPIHFLERMVRPLMWRIGEAWHTESLRVSAEHLASAAVRTFLGVSRMPSGSQPMAPRIVVATPARQMHEIGALAVATVAAVEG